ncbi:MAG TPA: histidine kinase [Blastocatellia bacterium]|nr:histidine kinase [Blastocatellia bacterium]
MRLSRHPLDLHSESLDDHLIVASRLILSLAALLIIWLDPAEPDKHVAATYLTLTLYVIYSAILYLLARGQVVKAKMLRPWLHWVDVGWYTLLISLSTGTNSLFFYGFYFAILVSSFRRGFISGFGTAIASAVIFTIVGVAIRYESGNFELNRFLIRPVALLVIGYMIAYWGGAEINLKKHLAFLREITRLSNPRLGSDHLLTTFLKQLRAFYQAEACLLVKKFPASTTYQLRRVTAHDAPSECPAEPITTELGQQLLSLPSNAVVVFQRQARRWWRRSAYDWAISGNLVRMEDEVHCEKIATLLDTDFYLSVPFSYHYEMTGRLWLTAQRKFDAAEAEFVRQVTEQIIPIIQHIRLIERLATGAAEEERQRLARDIHDSIIQPYIGLQLGLQALQKKVADEEAKPTIEIEQLLQLTQAGIQDLRQYIASLQNDDKHEQSVLTALRRYVTRFAEATGIEVQVQAGEGIAIANQWADEIIQMVSEGLSNIRRHTHAHSALIRLDCDRNHFVLKISNEQQEAPPLPFKPRSLTERAEALGGWVRVDLREAGRTTVVIEIPL